MDALPPSPASRTLDAPGARWYVALWLALALDTAVVLLVPDLPVAIHAPRLTTAIGSISAVIGLALLQLGVLRFRLLRRSLDLYAGLAFGVLAISNLFVVSIGFGVSSGELPLEPATYVVLVLRGLAACLFLLGLAYEWRERSSTRSTCAWVPAAWVVAIGVLGLAIVFAAPDRLPPLLDASAHARLTRGETIPDVLQGQQRALIAADGLLALALLVSAVGYTLEARRLRDPHLAALAAGLTIIFFAQVHGFLFPAVPRDYVSTADGLRAVAYGLLLSSLVWRTARDVAANASQAERLRLSREVHDGLAQQLAMLHLRLGRVSEATAPSDHRAHDLEIAQRILNAASLEARQTIAELRCDRVTWAEFGQVLTAFATEFALTQEVAAEVSIEPADACLESGLQAEVLCLVREAFSNAARHGAATRVEARLTAEAGVLRLSVQDNGRGFDPARVDHGVGLRSMAERVEGRRGRLVIDAAPGRGTRIGVWLPLTARPSTAA